MAAFISRKKSLVILLAGLCASVATAVVLHYLLQGPRLGPVYDFLLGHRNAPSVSRAIVLVDTDELVENGDIVTVLVTLSELDAGGLVIAVPVLGSSSGRTVGDEEIRRRFNDEYALLGRNIRNLFEAIRVGSVPPLESAAYVENLVELAERGRDRLTAALVRQDEAGSAQVARAAAVFGSVLEATDLRSRSVISGDWYARPWPDRDGALRRIAPMLAVTEDSPAPEPAALAAADAEETAPRIDHIAFRILKSRWSETGLLYAERGPVLMLRNNDGEETLIPLDRDGNILVEKPRQETGFRRLALEQFRAYEEAAFAMERLLRDAEALGVYSQIRPERIPLILWEYASGLWEELLETPDQTRRDAWIAARTEYFISLEELLYGPAEMALVNGFEEIIATETLKDEGLVKLQTLRDELIRVFVAMREQHRRLLEIRGLLAETLAASLCIMGPAAGESGAAESAAILANSLLTGCYIIPGQGRYVLFWSLAAACVMLVCIHALRPLPGMIAGLAAALLAAAGFGWSFIISGYWIDPLIPVVSILAGAAVIFTVKIAFLRQGARRFHLAYGPAVSKACLQELVRIGRPLLAEINTVPAAVIAVKTPLPQGQQDPVEAARAAATFRNSVSLAFKQAGAVIISYECDTVLACFGSPPERICQEQNNPEGEPAYAVRAGGCITELLGEAPRPWYFGIDWGECAFSWSAETGYTANGRPVIRARLLASLAPRCHAQVIISGAVREHIALPVRKLNQRIPGAAGQDGDLYELRVPNGDLPSRASPAHQ